MTSPSRPQTAQQDAAARAAIERYRLEQVALASAFLGEFIPIWSLLSWGAIDVSADAWVHQALKLIREWRQVSARLAERFYREHRLIRRPQLEPMPAIEYLHAPRDLGEVLRMSSGRNARTRSGELRDIENTARQLQRASESKSRRRRRDGAVRPRVDWAEHDKAAEVSMWVTGPVNLKRQARMGRTEKQAKDTALVQASGAAVRQVANGARYATIELVEQDPYTDRFARVTDGNPCAFCAMLASRGAVYLTKESASFEAHDHCQCHVIAVHDAGDIPQLNRDLQRLWNANIQGQFSGEDARLVWRRLYEGRALTGRAARKELAG